MASERESDDVSSPWRIGDDKEVKQVSLKGVLLEKGERIES